MKKKPLSALLIAGVLAVSSPAGAYAAEFSDSVSAQENAIPDGNLPQNDSFTPNGYISEPDKTEPQELFQAAPAGETELFSSGQPLSDSDKLSGAEAQFDAASDSNIPQVIDTDRVTYYYMEDKDSYIADEIYNPGGERIVIPAEYNGKKVTEIASNIYWPTFEDQDEFTIFTGDLELPEGLLVIHDRAFNNADFISLYVPDSVTEIGEKAFSNCGVRWLHFPAGMSIIPAGLFENCPQLETVEVPEGVTELTSGAFKECPALKSLYLPTTIIKMGEDLFAGNAQVTIYGTAGSYAEDYAREHNLPFSAEKEAEPAPNQETLIANGVRYTYEKSSDSYLVTDYTGDISEEIIIPEAINSKPVSGIGEKAFINCYRLRRVVLPSTIKSIGEGGFSQCLNLEEINLPDGLQSIGSSAFTECRLKYVSIPDSVKNFGTSIFYMCFDLKEVRLPQSMTSIPDYMFYWAHISTPLSLPSGIKSIGNYAFAQFIGEAPILPSGLTSIGDYAFNNSTIESIKIPNSVTKMGKEVFGDCLYLRTITWSKGLKTIPQGTFTSCLSLEEMRLPAAVTTIGKNAYIRSGIRRLSIPKSVKKIDKTAFKDCADLTLFVAKGSYAETFAKNNKLAYDNGAIANAIAEQDGIRYEYNSTTKTYTILEADKNIAGDINIPGTINGKKVVTIEKDAFRQCEKLRSVKLPDTITAIGTEAFYFCSSLEQINFPHP
ncbi:leucine-rich repeat domain-containing protein [Blautia schinkii]|nr:leucine-rich repeat domain-containing protein [Blautia schinkii]